MLAIQSYPPDYWANFVIWHSWGLRFCFGWPRLLNLTENRCDCGCIRLPSTDAGWCRAHLYRTDRFSDGSWPGSFAPRRCDHWRWVVRQRRHIQCHLLLTIAIYEKKLWHNHLVGPLQQFWALEEVPEVIRQLIWSMKKVLLVSIAETIPVDMWYLFQSRKTPTVYLDPAQRVLAECWLRFSVEWSGPATKRGIQPI